MSRKTILFADNDNDFRATRAEFLKNAGYRVLEAHDIQEAQRLLAADYVQLAILDVRMRRDDDEKDTSGLSLAKDPTYRLIPKIILTGFPVTDRAVEALRIQPDGQPLAWDFLAKAEGHAAMIQAIERVFEQQIRLNWDLTILWDQRERLSFLHLVDGLQSSLANETLLHRADELEGLVRRMFYDYQQIRIGQMLWRDRWRCCLPVLAQSPQGAIDPRILICGERDWLDQELKRVRELAPEVARTTKLVNTTQTMHFSAVAYVLPDADLETIQPLRELSEGSGRENSLRKAIDHLLKEVLPAWHQRGHMVSEGKNIMTLYRQRLGPEENELSQIEAERRVEALVHATLPLSPVQIKHDPESITFQFPGQSPLVYPDPVTAAYLPMEQYGLSVSCKVSPGHITADNVLIDSERRTWLTDFAYAGQAPPWWDFVCLEAIIRFDLSHALDLVDWLEFEKCLAAPTNLHESLRLQDVGADLRASVDLIERIRRQAGSETGSDPLPYYAGLLAWTIDAMGSYDSAALLTRPERMRAAHLLLAASVLAKRLGESFPPQTPGGALRLDGEGGVWIGDRRVAGLDGKLLGLMRCLYEQRDHTVSRQVIMRSISKDPYRPDDLQQESRINTLITRLREKIEPNPQHPRYIINERGKGYRLRVKGE